MTHISPKYVFIETCIALVVFVVANLLLDSISLHEPLGAFPAIFVITESFAEIVIFLIVFVPATALAILFNRISPKLRSTPISNLVHKGFKISVVFLILIIFLNWYGIQSLNR